MDQENQTHTTPNSPKKPNTAIMSAVIVLVIIAVAAGMRYANKEEEAPTPIVEANTQPTNETNPIDPSPSSETPITTDTPPTTNETTPNSTYKDGTYTALGNYTSPGGAEQIKIILTVKGDVVTNAESEVLATRPASKNFQTIFTENFKTFVVGKDLDEVKLDKVSGSSLTPKGFNDAVTQIKSQAQS